MKAFLILVITSAVIMPVPLSGQTKKSAEQAKAPLVTFVELGSVKCVPCRAMHPVMKAIEEKYAGQVSVVFHDVWKAD